MSDQLSLDNLSGLYTEEEKLRVKALELVSRDSQLQLHVAVIGNAMNLADLFRQFPSTASILTKFCLFWKQGRQALFYG